MAADFFGVAETTQLSNWKSVDSLANFLSHNQTSGLPGDADVGGAGDAHEKRRREDCRYVYAALHALVLSLPDWPVGRAELFVSAPSFPHSVR